MDDLEESTSICKGDEGSSRPVADIDDQLSLADVDGFKLQSRACILLQPAIIRVQWLVGSDQLPIHAKISYGGDDVREVLDCCVSASC